MKWILKPAQWAICMSAMLALGGAIVSAQPPGTIPEPYAPMPPQPVRTPPVEPIPAPQAAANPLGSQDFFGSPSIDQNSHVVMVPPAAPLPTDRPLPINLATALYLSNARPLVIAFARNSVEIAAAQYQQAKVAWLPNLNAGVNYIRHSGEDQATSGQMTSEGKYAFAAGAGATLDFGLSDAIFLPLAARQQLVSREFDVQAARNDALANVAAAYFDVQGARGRLAGNLEAINQAEALEKQIRGLSGAGRAAGGLVPQIEIDRVLALKYYLQQEAATSRASWQSSSAQLNRVLRLDPGAVVVPVEPPQLQVTLIQPGTAVDDLIPVGLLNRPELASRKAVVRATLERLRQERLRPLLPSVVVQGGGPGGAFNLAAFQGGPDGQPTEGSGRYDLDVGVVWTLDNLGAGNRAAVRERTAEQQRAMLEVFNTEDRVAEEVVTAHAQLEAAVARVRQTEASAREASTTFAGTRIGLRETRGAGGMLELINRPQEAVAALQQLNQAYDAYFSAVNDYNRAQFQLYRAMGYPARTLICDRPLGEIQNADTSRTPCMSPVCPGVISRPCP